VNFGDIGGVTLHFAHRPAADARHLVFINSLGTDFRIWNAVTEALSGDVSTLVYDKRGHGLSDLGATPCSIEDHVDDLVGLIDHLGIADMVLCGLSVGGLVAQGFYARDLGALIVNGKTQGERITVRARVFDGTVTPLRNVLIEIWQADAAGLYNSPSEMRGAADPNFCGWGRKATDMESGECIFETIRPGRVPFRIAEVGALYTLVEGVPDADKRRLAEGTACPANTGDDVSRGARKRDFHCSASERHFPDPGKHGGIADQGLATL
jgi:pimeloyl-ACP methyl ester carboxylesterase